MNKEVTFTNGTGSVKIEDITDSSIYSIVVVFGYNYKYSSTDKKYDFIMINRKDSTNNCSSSGLSFNVNGYFNNSLTLVNEKVWIQFLISVTVQI